MARGTISEIKAGIWLLWVGFGLGATLSAAGFSWLISQLVSVTFYAIWCANNLDGKVMLRSFLFSILEIFFRNVDVAGSARIPDTGPVLFACGPHNNQFVDGIVMLRATAKRKDVAMIAAAVTMRRKYVGKGAKMLGAVPVERPQDLAVTGKGKITLNPGTLICHSAFLFVIVSLHCGVSLHWCFLHCGVSCTVVFILFWCA
jgi:1-acyl-sn-glycerol-3-phosphate acyltransferase